MLNNLSFPVCFRVEAVVSVLAEVKDRPGGSGTDGDDHKTGNAQRTLFEEIASEQYGNADAEAVTGERIDEDMDVLGFEAEKARGTWQCRGGRLARG